MSEMMFDRLLEELRDCLTISYKHSFSSTSGNEPIFPEVIMACGIRFLSGDSVSSLADIHGISTSSVRLIVNIFLDAVDFNNTFEQLQVRLPDQKKTIIN